MKSFIAIALFGLLAVAAAAPAAVNEAQLEKAGKIIAACKEQHKVSDEVIAKLKKGEFAGMDNTAKCFAQCFMKSAGFTDDQGNMDPDTVMKKLANDQNREQIATIVETCKNKGGSTPCERGFNTYTCARAMIL